MKRITARRFAILFICLLFLTACSKNKTVSTSPGLTAREIAQRQFENDLAKYNTDSNAQLGSTLHTEEKPQLEITNVTLTRNGNYLIAEGSVKNSDAITYKFIKVKCSFKDSDGNVIDTDDTYACGSEGLDPNESTKFKLYIDNDWRIQSVSARIYDFD